MIPVRTFYENKIFQKNNEIGSLSEAGYTSVEHFLEASIEEFTAKYRWCAANIDENDFIWLVDKVWFTRDTDAVLFKLSC